MSRQFLGFLLVGGVAAAANWLSRFAFGLVLGLQASVVCAYLVGMATAYVLSRLFVFEPSGRKVHDEVARFTLVNLFALGVVYLVTMGLARYAFPAIGFSWHAEAVAHGVGVLSPAVTSYLGHRYFTYAKREAPPEAQSAPASDVSHATPLAVDMDGTLLRTDVLAECLVAGLFARPVEVLRALPLLLRGRPAFKARLAEIAPLDISRLPVREPLLRHLERLKAQGRPLHLVTAACGESAHQVAARFGLFDAVHASGGGVNLKGARKLQHLQGLFPGGFAYAGDSAADLAVWRGAEGMVICGARRSVAARARSLGKTLEAEFQDGVQTFRTWRRALRLHQWSKNLLIFVPLFLGPHLTSARAAAACLAGFVIASVAASATYLINDLADLEADRKHRTKRLRPLASGDLPIAHALVAAPLMLAAALVAAFALSTAFAACLIAYLAITLAYSFRIKRVALLDVTTLGVLYTLRLVFGTALAQVEFSPWLLTFSMFFFFSMSLAKRHVEVSGSEAPVHSLLPGRGYRPADAPLTLALGVASSTAAILVIVQYMMADAFPSNVYARPAFLWAAPIFVGLWICRVWLLAHRGELHDDPVAFAIKDQLSLTLGALMACAFLLARV